MDKAWTDIHWRGFAVAVVVAGVVATTRAGSDGAHFAPLLQQAQASLRELPAPTSFSTPNVELASRVDLAETSDSGGFDKRLAACAAQSRKYRDRDAQCALASTIITTTTHVIERNAAHAVVLADAHP